MKTDEKLPSCDLCGEHHEMLAGEKQDECPEAWAVEHLKQYESMYLKWCKSESKIQNLEAANARLFSDNADLKAKLEKAVEVISKAKTIVNREISEYGNSSELVELMKTLAELREKGERE